MALLCIVKDNPSSSGIFLNRDPAPIVSAEVIPLDPIDRSHASATGKPADSGESTLSRAGIHVRAARYTPGTVQRPHEHAAGTMTLVYRGDVIERVGNREERARALSVVVKPPGVRHANRFGPAGASTLQVTFEPHLLEAWDGEWRLGAWRWMHDGVAARPFMALLASLRLRAAPCGGPGDAPGSLDKLRDDAPNDSDLESLIYDLCASVGPSAASPDGSRAPSGGLPPPWLARVRARVLEEAAEPLRVRDLAREAGVHPVSLARAFRRHYGAPIRTVLRRHRVTLAAARLEGGDEPLPGVALEAGFADQSHLCRAFKATTGVTPLGFRRLARS